MPTVNLTSLIFVNGATVNQPFAYRPSIAVYNTGREVAGPQNGGACCCAPVPLYATGVQIEVWGGGGDGPGACCCQGPYRSAGAGEYTKTTFCIPTGTTYYNICAGGSGCCSCGCCGTCGFPSFVLNPAGTVIACAQGGSGGCGVCGHMGGLACTGICQSSCSSGMCAGCGGLGCIQIYAQTQGNRESNFCTNQQWQWLPGSVKMMPNAFHSQDSCARGMTTMGCARWNSDQYGTWPGGAGSSAQACGGGCCWGGWGMGGLVLLTYI